jgi:hypothetical protein
MLSRLVLLQPKDSAPLFPTVQSIKLASDEVIVKFETKLQQAKYEAFLTHLGTASSTPTLFREGKSFLLLLIPSLYPKLGWQN